jgi:hypothetical protein
MNSRKANFCVQCGKQLRGEVLRIVGAEPAPVQLVPPPVPEDDPEDDFPDDGEEEEDDADDSFMSMGDDVVMDFMPIPPREESFLEKLDRMEQELENRQNQSIPEPPPGSNDKLDAHEETLKNIGYTLDSLIADLLEAEVREFSFPDFIQPDGTGFPPRDGSIQHGEQKKNRSLQEILVIIALIAAIFLVGLSFGLWGSYFFGI